jgi:hypothetical protein
LTTKMCNLYQSGRVPLGSIKVDRGAIEVRFDYDPEMVRVAQKIASEYGVNRAWRGEKKCWRFPGELAEVVRSSFPFPTDKKFAELACKVDDWGTNEQAAGVESRSTGPNDSIIMIVLLRSYGEHVLADEMHDRVFGTFMERHAD